MAYNVDRLIFDTQREMDAYFDGLREGIKLFAWWKDGTQYVGSCGTTLKSILLEIDKEYNRLNPQVKMEEIPYDVDNPFKGDD